MERLWAPWRMQYIMDVEKTARGECIFCAKPKQDNDRENLILLRGAKNFVILNLYPYNNGHLMVVPYEHTCDCTALSPETLSELWGLVGVSKRALEEAFHAEGFNIGMNLGRAAGAGIDQHVHMHVVPRWNGDTNFMPVITQTKVVSQGPDETYEALLPYFSSGAIGNS
jgi:ATP adenylyltransferase